MKVPTPPCPLCGGEGKRKGRRYHHENGDYFCYECLDMGYEWCTAHCQVAPNFKFCCQRPKGHKGLHRYRAEGEPGHGWTLTWGGAVWGL